MKFTKSIIALIFTVSLVATADVSFAQEAPKSTDNPKIRPTLPPKNEGANVPKKQTTTISNNDSSLDDVSKDRQANPSAKNNDTPNADKSESTEKKKNDKKVNPLNQFLIPAMLGIFVLLMFMSGRKRRKQEAARMEKISNLKKGTKVISIGGIVGTVISSNNKTGEITLAIDNKGTQMTFVKNAIQTIKPQNDGSELEADQNK